MFVWKTSKLLSIPRVHYRMYNIGSPGFETKLHLATWSLSKVVTK